MNVIRTAISALLPLGLLALWLAPTVEPVERTADVHGVHADGPMFTIEASPLALADVEPPGLDDTPRRALTPRAIYTDRSKPRPPTLDAATRARSAGPLHRVLRSGQAHRSAP